MTGYNEKAKTEKDDVSAAANDYLKTLGFVSVAYAWIKVLQISFKDYNDNRNFYEDKINTAKFYFDIKFYQEQNNIINLLFLEAQI